MPLEACKKFCQKFVVDFYRSNTLMALESKFVRYKEHSMDKFKEDMARDMLQALRDGILYQEMEKRDFTKWLEWRVNDCLRNIQGILSKYGKDHGLLQENTYIEEVMKKANDFEGLMKPWTNRRRMRVKGLRTDNQTDGQACGFLPYNTRATNAYRNVEAMAYPMNVYQHGDVRSYFDEQGISTSEDLYAISPLVQWLWRSRIRKEPRESITVYLPSERMRGLFLEWLWSDSTAAFVKRKMDGARRALKIPASRTVRGARTSSLSLPSRASREDHRAHRIQTPAMR